MSKFLKENWFVAVIAVFFLCISVYFAYDQNKGKLPGKTVNGKDVVFSVDDTDFTADDLYNELAKSYKDAETVNYFQQAVLDESVKSTDELINDVKTQYNNIVSYYYSNYGYSEDYLNQIAQYYYGYSTFYDYLLYSSKASTLYKDYIKAHFDEVFTTEKMNELQSRIVSYVVIAMDNPAAPTEEEQKLLDEAQAAWASDEYDASTFGKFAAKYTQDSNAANEGKFGYVDKNTTGIDTIFLQTALSLKEGEVSEWVYSEKFGYFLIKCDSTKAEDLVEEADFVNTVLDSNDNLANQIMWNKAQELGVSFSSEEIEKLVKDSLKLESDGE